LSKNFYASLGWKVEDVDDGMALVQLADQHFYIQNYYLKEFAENCMLHLTVEDAQAWYIVLLQENCHHFPCLSFGVHSTKWPQLRSSANDSTHPPSLLSNTTYNALDELTAAESGTVTGASGFSQVWNYDTRGRTTYCRSAINGGPTIQIQSGITYWGNGDVLGFSDGILGYTWGYGSRSEVISLAQYVRGD